MDDKCAECWQLWRQNFTFLSWSGLVERAQDRAFQVLLKQVRGVMKGEAPPPSRAEELQSQTTFSLEIEHAFICMSDKEFKRATGLMRVPKGATKSVPVLKVPCQGGQGYEDVMMFRDPERPFRRAKVKVQQGMAVLKEEMPKKFFTYTGQAEDNRGAFCHRLHADSGVASMLEKEVHMLSWDEFCTTKLGMKEENEEPEVKDEPALPSLNETPHVYKGPAAEAIVVSSVESKSSGHGAGLLTPAKKATSSPNLPRHGSGDNISVSGSHGKGKAEGSMRLPSKASLDDAASCTKGSRCPGDLSGCAPGVWGKFLNVIFCPEIPVS